MPVPELNHFSSSENACIGGVSSNDADKRREKVRLKRQSEREKKDQESKRAKLRWQTQKNSERYSL